MHSPIELLQLYKVSIRKQSNRAAAKVLGVSQPAFASWMNGRSIPDDKFIPAIAEALNMNEGYIASCFHGARVKDSLSQQMWERMAATFQGATPVVFVIALAAMGMVEFTDALMGSALLFTSANPSIHYALIMALALIVALQRPQTRLGFLART